MPQSEERPLNQVLAEFQARRAPTMNPEALRVNIEQRRRLVDETSRATFVKSADVVPDFTLEDVEGGIPLLAKPCWPRAHLFSSSFGSRPARHVISRFRITAGTLRRGLGNWARGSSPSAHKFPSDWSTSNASTILT